MRSRAFRPVGLPIYVARIPSSPFAGRRRDTAAFVRQRPDSGVPRMAGAGSAVIGNLRLVVTVAHDYANLGLPLLDLVSEGNIGLTKAVERFDPAKGAKLSTYAAWWIKQSIKRALANQAKTIRLPVHLVDKVAKVHRVSLQMSDELGREPTDEELGEEIGIDSEKVARF